MTRTSERAFVWLDRAFWVIWLAFPLWIGLLASEVLNPPGEAPGPGPDLEDGSRLAPASIGRFSLAGQATFWLVFAAHVAFFAAVLAMAHRVVRSCARGQVLVAPLIRTLRAIGATIALYPVADLVLMNLSVAVYAAAGDVPAFVPVLDLDLTVLGVGLLLITLAFAMERAVELQRDADLTI